MSLKHDSLRHPSPHHESAHSDFNVDTQRRGLFRALGRGVKGAIEVDDITTPNAIRPLGAVEESVFQRLCNQCGDCVTSCPQQILFMTPTGPEMDLSFNHCTFCLECINHCQHQALTSLSQTDTGWRPQFLNNCNARSSGNCEECADDCPQQAITIASKQLPSLSPHCNGCGECVSSCYGGAIVMRQAN